MENLQHISAASQMFEQADTVLRHWEQGSNLNRCLKDYNDRSLLTNIIYNIFRHRAVLDWIIDRHVKYKIDATLRNVLRISLCDILYLHGMPKEVVADVAVRFSKQKHSRKKANFINGVIRNILRAGAEDTHSPGDCEKEKHCRKYISAYIFHSLPPFHNAQTVPIVTLKKLNQNSTPNIIFFT